MKNSDPFIKAAEGALIIDSHVNGELFLDRYATIKETITQGFNGIGCFSYVRRSRIGRYTHFGSRVSIGGANHPLDWLSIGSFQYRDDCWSSKCHNLPFDEGEGAQVGNDVWIGDNSVLCGGIEIGTGAIIGAGTVVTKSVEPYSIVIGNPARLLRKRFDEKICEKIIFTRWWNKDPHELEKLPFNDIELFIDQYNERFGA